MRSHFKLLFSMAALAAVIAVFHALPARDAILRQLWSFNQAQYQEFAEKVPARKLPRPDKRFSFMAGDSLPPTPVATPAGGSYSQPIAVALTAPEGKTCAIRYTLDGSIPTYRDSVYTGKPIPVDTFTVLRFRCLNPGMLPGDIVSETYITSARPDGLPVISLITDPVNLWNKYTGIYEHPLGRGRKWMRQADLHLLRPGEPPLSLAGELRIHGGYSRVVPKKSFRFSFKVPENMAISSDHLLLRTQWRGENTVIIRGGGVAQAYRLRDALSATLYSKIGGQTSAAEPIFLRLNGQPWGVYDLRERIDQGWLNQRFGPGDYELMGFDSKTPGRWGTPILGNGQAWENMIRFFREQNPSEPPTLESARQWLDIDNTIDYWIHNIFIANVDWPYNNFNAWRSTGPQGVWRWISWDVDGTFDHQGRGLNHNTLEWSLRERIRNDLKWNYVANQYEDKAAFLQSTLIMRRLLENPEIRNRFVARAHDLMNSVYAPDSTLPVFSEIITKLKIDRELDFQRWGWKDSLYFAEIERVSAFLKKRPEIVRGHLAARFGLQPSLPLHLQIQGPGRIRIHSVTVADSSWVGLYPQDFEIELEALPDPGAIFVGWENQGAVLSTEGLMRFRLKGEMTFRAQFKPAE